jgi:hypothetical protein
MDGQQEAPALIRNVTYDDPAIKVTLKRTEWVAGPAPSLRNLNAGLGDLIKDRKQALLDVASRFDNSHVQLKIHRKHPLFG